jgi:hypothetical protein
MTQTLWIWTDHIRLQIKERKIPLELVESTINNPNNIVSGRHGRSVYQKAAGNKLIRVVAEGNKLITVYITDKLNKYII